MLGIGRHAPGLDVSPGRHREAAEARCAAWPRALLVVAAALAQVACAMPATPTSGDRIPARYERAPVEHVRDSFTATLVRPMTDVRWIEATLLDRAVVERETVERERLLGSSAEAARLAGSEAARAATRDRASIEIWLSTSCERCLDLRRWGFVLIGPSGVARRPRWIESEVMDAQEQTISLMGAERRVTLSWVRALIVFEAGAVPADGDLALMASRPEGWDEPVELRWKLGEPSPLTSLLNEVAP